jgi:hypothetical protein
MGSLQQYLADTSANLNAQLCELIELRERVREAALSASKSPQPKLWNGHSAIRNRPVVNIPHRTSL